MGKTIGTALVAAALAWPLAGCGGGDGGAGASGDQSLAKAGTVQLPAPALDTPAASRPTPAATPASNGSQMLRPFREAMRDGAARAIVPQPVEISTRAGSSHYPGGVAIAHDDPRLRWLGGRGLVGTNYPYSLARTGVAVTNGPASELDGRGLPRWRSAINGGLEFTLLAGENAFELAMIGAGAPWRVQLEIDGAATSADGYDAGPTGDGALRYTQFVLPPASSARRVRLWIGNRPVIGLRLPAGATLGERPSDRHDLSVVFQGDSISAGSVASHPVLAWPSLAAYRMGVANPIMVAVGGSGYLARWPRDRGLTLRERLTDVTEAVDGSPPDAVVVAGGINDCGVALGGPFTAADVGAEARAYFTALRAAAPRMTIVVLGPFTDWSNFAYSATSQACRDAIFAAARDVEGVYTVDVADWVTAANRGQVFDGTRNGPHPTDSGHALYAERFAEAWARIVHAPRD